MKTKKIIYSLIDGIIIVGFIFWFLGIEFNSLKVILVFIGLILFNAVLEYYLWSSILEKFFNWLKLRNDKIKP